MQLDIDPDGLVHLALIPDEHLKVPIGSAEVVLIGGMVGSQSEGPLVQVVIQEWNARAEVKHFPPEVWQEYVDIRIVPRVSDES